MTLPALRVAPSPMVTSDFSDMAQPSSKTPRPIRTPISFHITGLNGVPLKIATREPMSFQTRSCHQKYGS
jgi:hypothetical protein